MIVTDKLLFLHLHKSAGTFVNLLLMRCVPSSRQIGYHLPYREVPADYRDRPVVGTVRNPWAYYVSWYHFQAKQPNPNILFKVCSDDAKLGFSETVTNLIGLSDDERRLGLLRDALPETYANHGINLTKKCVGELRERGVGFYSFLFERLYAESEAPTIMRAERLRDELRSVLTALGQLPNRCAERYIEYAPALNASPHEAPEHYFNDELAAFVALRDSTVIERFGYSLGS